MSDRELLELAAKAGGIDYKPDNKDWKHDDHCAFWSYDDLCTCGARWNPLTDDGDAFRLAVKLGLVVDTLNGRVILAERLGKGHRDWTYGATEDEVFDDDFATRRAIVRAAAEIGRNMK